jgi:hypothetical protein
LADAANEDSQGKTASIDFFEIFGITNKRVAFLFETYQQYTSLLLAGAAKAKRKAKAA